MSADRTAVLWMGDAPSLEIISAVANRGLKIESCTEPTDTQLNSACATVFCSETASGAVIRNPLLLYSRSCLIHGHRVILRSKASVSSKMLGIEGADRWTMCQLSRTADDLAELARGGLESAGPPATGPQVNLPDPLGIEDTILLSRAFADCDIVQAKELKEGKSAARVLRVLARRKNQQPPGYLLPYLVKVDDIAAIQTEAANYCQFVDGHIPFSQRPNLREDRKVVGAKRAVMVSDFVDEAHSLSEICKRPESRTVLYSLFDDALRSWRRDAFKDSTDPPCVPITDYLVDIVKPADVRDAVVSRAKAFGSNAAPNDLLNRLTACSSHRYRIGTIHGDLHPGNVMVRRQEAILIDFASIWENRPIIADLACLEVAACFTVAPDGCAASVKRVREPAFGRWKTEIEKLFSCACLTHVPPLQEPSDFDWLWTLCRQTRGMALQAGASSASYACALAVYLLRRARLSTSTENPSVGALSLATAKRLIKDLEDTKI